ncbi:hypothetical protein BJ165DRAFT_681577 [Panaeolus papilionaceus]|nr:hypothetical protein BJ165DRAFT_681577 [Panaeolus papilionaceus]
MDEYSSFSLHVREEYKQLMKTQNRLMETPSLDGKQIVEHALAVACFFEGLGRLQPITNAIVTAFKRVVLYEREQRESDARARCVLLAQTDMMGVFLQLEDLHRKHPSHLKSRDNEERLYELQERIVKDIKDCGSSLDAYDRERRLVRLLKIDQWKQRMEAFSHKFATHKRDAQLLLGFRIQQSVDQLHTKIDELDSRVMKLLNALFAPKDSQEQEAAQQTRKYGSRRAWVQKATDIDEVIGGWLDSADNASYKRALHELTDKTSSASNDNEDPQAALNARKAAFIKGIREEASIPVEELCSRNLRAFESKLDFLAERLKDAIDSSAQTIIGALGSPHDRLNHKDLRELWKEMKWIFCVDKNQFFFALQEYYLDQFVPRHGVNDSSSRPARGALMKKSRLGNDKTHPDAWTLGYLFKYSDRILNSIDKDSSGFVRISEANDFTFGIPPHWSLPQWCAYHAVGWIYESRIYQLRIRRLFVKLCETQATANSFNRQYMTRTLNYLGNTLFGLAWSPVDVDRSQSPTSDSELIRLVHSKITVQDESYRQMLRKINQESRIDTRIIEMTFDKQNVEEYVLVLVTLLLEEWLKVYQLCATEILDAREFSLIRATANDVMNIVTERLLSFQETGGPEKGLLVFEQLEKCALNL